MVVRPVTETAQPEPALNENLGWLPSRPFMINRAGETPQLVATFALFNARTSELRLIEEAAVNIYQSLRTNDDYSRPSILSTEMRIVNGNTKIMAEISDNEGEVYAAYATFVSASQIWSLPLELDIEDVNRERWIGTTDAIYSGTGYFIQAVDAAGNTSLVMGKGEYLQAVSNKIYLPLILRH